MNYYYHCMNRKLKMGTTAAPSAGMAFIVQSGLLQYPYCGLSDMGNRIRYFDACRVQCFDFVVSRSLAAADDGARMTHAFAGRRLTAADEPDNRFLHGQSRRS